MKFYLISSGYYSEYRIAGIVAAPDSVDVAAVEREWRAAFMKRKDELLAAGNTGAYLQAYDERRSATERYGKDLDMEERFLAMLVAEHGCTKLDYVEVRPEDP